MSPFDTAWRPEALNSREIEILGLIKDGLTNQEIAQKLFLSLDTVKWYNKHIFSKLGVNSRIQAIEKAREYGLLGQTVSFSPKIPLPRQNYLPAELSSFIGREKEITDLTRLLHNRDIRLVTILGPNGVGKTRLSLQVACRLLSGFQDGVFFVSMAALSDPGQVVSTVAQVIGLHEAGIQPIQKILFDALHDKQLLLVLDNFEHLLPAAQLVHDLLISAPGLKILVTSRAPLHVYGEHPFPISSLSLPDPADLPFTQDLIQYEAIHLFVERARAVKIDFVLSAENTAEVAKICQRLDGLPLAIELAAARAHLLTPADMAAQFDGREGRFPFEMLAKGPVGAPARHQTLYNAIAWSYDLLEPDEQALFRRMGVFAGSCTAEAVAEICMEAQPDSPTVSKVNILPMLDSLVEKNLLVQSMDQGEHRYNMLEMIRAYALEQLAASGVKEHILQRHADYFLKMVAVVRESLHSVTGMQGVNRLARERDNLRGMLNWGLGDSASYPFKYRVRQVLDWVDETHLPTIEILQWIEKALARLAEKPAGPFDREQRILQGDLYAFGGAKAFARGDPPAARRLFERGIAIFRQLDDKPRIGTALIIYCAALYDLGHYRLAKIRAEEALALGSQFEQAWVIGHALDQLGWLAWCRGDYPQAEKFFAESVEVFKQDSNPVWEAVELTSIGQLAQDRGDQERARELYREALSRCWKMNDMWGIGLTLEKVARSVAAHGQHRRSVRLFAATQALFLASDITLLDGERPGHEKYLGLARGGLDPDEYDAAWAEGQSLTLEQAVTEALTDDPFPPPLGEGEPAKLG